MTEFEKLKSQQDSIYTSYGKFAIQFEQLCGALRHNILFALSKYGLSEQTMTRILLADLTAYSLVIKCRSIVSFIYSESPESIKHIDPIFKACIKIIEKRNLIIHGRWMLPSICDHNIKTNKRFDIALGMKDKIIKSGVVLETNEYSENEFNNLTKKIELAKNLIYNIQACFQLDKDIKTISQKKINELND